MNYSFYCRESKKNRQGLAPIEISIVVNGERHYINTQLKVKPEEFNRKRRPQYITDYINTQTALLSNYIIEMTKKGVALTAPNIINIIRSGGIPTYTLSRLFKEYLTLLEQRIDVDLTLATYRKYQLVTDLFIKHTGDIECAKITTHEITSFYTLLKSKYETETSCGYMTKLKAVFKYAFNTGKITTNPFVGTKIQKSKKKIEILSDEEYNRIVNMHFDIERLENVRKAFVFQMNTGLSYQDMKGVTKNDILTTMTENGTVSYLKGNRLKNGNEYLSVILKDGVKVLEEGFTIISNQRYNGYLKEIQDLCGIKTTLHTHLARHQYASYLIKNHIPMSTIARTLGHSNPSTTARFYARLTDTTVIEEVAAIAK